MSIGSLNDYQLREANRLKNEGMSYEKIAKTLRLSKSSIFRALSGDAKYVNQEQIDLDQGVVFKENIDGTAVAASITNKPVKTLADAVKVAGVDLLVWYVDKWEAGEWTVGMKLKKGKDSPEEVIQTQQYRVKLFLKRILPRSINNAIFGIFEKIGQHAPKYANLPAINKRKEPPSVCVVGLSDVHFGKLCWGQETGKDYDLKIAEAMYSNAIDDILKTSRHRNVVKWILPIGNDHFHIDNSRNTTYAGTPQDVDGRFENVIKSGMMAPIRGIEKLITIAPVEVQWIPGNHDPTTSFFLALLIKFWFRNCKRVTVDSSPSPRKYCAFESTLLGFTHGNEEKHDQLPNLMATERPKEWAGAICREWVLGHMHRSRQWITKPIDSHAGTVIRVLQTITGTDSWHHRKGYVGTRQAAEALYYDRHGFSGQTVIPARKK